MLPRRGKLAGVAFSLLLALGLVLSGIPAAFAQDQRPARTLSDLDTDLRLDEPVTIEQTLNRALIGAEGRRDVVVRLSEPPSALVGNQAAHTASIEAEQNAVLARVLQLDPQARLLGSTRVLLNAMMLEIDGAILPTLASETNITSINPVLEYEQALNETVPYIGATPEIQARSNGGEGVRVAVLDSGIDYMHAKLGGPGGADLYAAAYCGDANATPDPFDPTCNAHSLPAPAFFPNDKVVGGYDFVGEVWPDGDLLPDANPLDFENHGTHVADIIGGLPLDDPERARIRVLHASPDAPNVDVLVDGLVAFADVPFESFTDYVSLPPGTYNVQVVPAGATDPVVIEADLTLEAGTDYTVAATDLLASIAPNVLTGDRSDPAADNALLRFAHFSPDAPAVDIAVADGGPVLFENAEFGDVAEYIEVPAGSYDLEVRLADTDTVVLSLPGISLAEGESYSAYAVGLVGNGTLGAVLSSDDPELNGGVAPGVELYAVKVCSAVSSACSGVALLQGMDFAADPNGDGRTDDAVDLINMSLGASYGFNYYDDLSQAVENADAIGILTVASAGNEGDKPYITGTPAAATSALSVAQTEVPSSFLPLLELDGVGSIQAVFQPWSVSPTEVIEGPAQYGDGAGGNLLGCEPFAPGSLSGKVVLVDRGECAFSAKISNIAAGDARAGIIGLVTPGEPFPGGFGGGEPTIPGYMISLDDADLIRANLGKTIRIDPASGIPLVQHMVGSSARGPTQGAVYYPSRFGYQYGHLIKPEIGAPGASVSAVAGSGSGSGAFGGTSGAAPMVTGAAALLKAESLGITPPLEIKARLMNTAETEIYNRPVALGGDLAPISRIGNGEVRIDDALQAGAAAWELNGAGASLSFGFVNVGRNRVRIWRTVQIKNYTDRPITYYIYPTFRFDDDEANGAVTVTPSRNRVQLRPLGSTFIRVRMEIDGSKLQPYLLNSGPDGANGDLLTQFEYDGYLNFVDTLTPANNLHMAWHVLPRLSANVRTSPILRFNSEAIGLPAADLRLRNLGIGDATLDVFSWLGSNPTPGMPGPAGSQMPNIAIRDVGVSTFGAQDLCTAGFGLAFGVSLFEPISHKNYPVAIELYFDTNRDGIDDYVAFTAELGNFASDGRNVTVVGPVDGPYEPFFFTDHSSNSANLTMLLCGEQLGLTGNDLLTRVIDVDAFSFDNYFTGTLTGEITGMSFLPLGERYVVTDGADFLGSVEVPARSNSTATVVDYGAFGSNPTEQGLLLFLRGGGINETRRVLAP